MCPACLRIRDRVPAGFLALSGAFLEKHHDEILNLLRNVVDAQQKEHPVKRIMDVVEEDASIVVTFTDIHLPRTVGEAIKRAYDGDLEIQYAEESGMSRVYWSRNQ